MGASHLSYGPGPFKVASSLMSALGLVTVAKPADSSEPGASSREAEDATMRAGDSGGRLCYGRMNRECVGRMMTAVQFCGMRLGNLVASPFRYDLAYGERGCGSVLATVQIACMSSKMLADLRPVRQKQALTQILTDDGASCAC